MKKSEVIITKWADLSPMKLQDQIRDQELKNTLINASKVGIKVNLAAGHRFKPETAVVTNLDVLYWLVESIIAINPEVSLYILESDSIGRGFAKDKFAFQGYEEIFQNFKNVHLYDLSHTPVEVYSCAGIYFKEGIVLSEIFKELDFFISLGKMKTHTNTTITGCLKNQFGCFPESDKEKYHPYLPAVIADINSAIKPDISILEACPAMEGNGPIFGTPKDLGLVLMSCDPVAIDSIAAQIMGFRPNKIPMLVEAENIGLGNWQTNNIEIKGQRIETVKVKFSFIPLEQKTYVNFGFFLQRFADRLHRLGHQIHLIPGTLWAIQKILGKLFKKVFHGTGSPTDRNSSSASSLVSSSSDSDRTNPVAKTK